MAKKITRVFIRVDLDINEVPTAVKVRRYRIEDSGTPGTRTGGGKNIVKAVADMNKTMHNTGAVGEFVKDIIADCRTDAGI